MGRLLTELMNCLGRPLRWKSTNLKLLCTINTYMHKEESERPVIGLDIKYDAAFF